MTEELNAYGVMKGSVVNVNILEAKVIFYIDFIINDRSYNNWIGMDLEILIVLLDAEMK